MELTTIAEGIEAADQLRELHESGCHLGQGYFFAKPLESDEVEALLGLGQPASHDRAICAGRSRGMRAWAGTAIVDDTG